jgi:uracil-DNA glycosylase
VFQRQPTPMETSTTKTLTWADLLGPEKTAPYFLDLLSFVAERRRSAEVYPPATQVFESIRLCTLENLKVVVVGQDPYHGPGQAHGLSFSVQPGTPAPPSLVNIFKELQDDLGIPPAGHGYLESWARQGVLMLNSVLTVERSKPKSHADRGWERFTDKVIEMINRHGEGIVFLLWGSPAQKKGRQIDHDRHLVLKAPHPSPLSAHRGFFGCRHFSQCNDYLTKSGREPIQWALPELKSC